MSMFLILVHAFAHVCLHILLQHLLASLMPSASLFVNVCMYKTLPITVDSGISSEHNYGAT